MTNYFFEVGQRVVTPRGEGAITGMVPGGEYADVLLDYCKPDPNDAPSTFTSTIYKRLPIVVKVDRIFL